MPAVGGVLHSSSQAMGLASDNGPESLLLS